MNKGLDRRKEQVRSQLEKLSGEMAVLRTNISHLELEYRTILDAIYVQKNQGRKEVR
jgi:hypothetical protein